MSAEPLLDCLDLTRYMRNLDWVTTGCEQAAKKKRRRMSLDWLRSIDAQCQKYNVPHFFKQYYANKSGLHKDRPQVG
ncbi:DUF5131 family protein [Pirellulales bacterium]|nr:DUF5131 family protein [Pirellulales bacterium]